MLIFFFILNVTNLLSHLQVKIGFADHHLYNHNLQTPKYTQVPSHRRKFTEVTSAFLFH